MFTKSKSVASILATYAVKLNPTLSMRSFFFYGGLRRVSQYCPLQGSTRFALGNAETE